MLLSFDVLHSVTKIFEKRLCGLLKVRCSPSSPPSGGLDLRVPIVPLRSRDQCTKFFQRSQWWQFVFVKDDVALAADTGWKVDVQYMPQGIRCNVVVAL